MSRSRSWPFVSGLVLVALVSYTVVAAPFFLIQPFSPQSEADLAIGYTLRRWSLLLTIAFLAIGVVLVRHTWRASGEAEPSSRRAGLRRRFSRGIAGVALVALAGPPFLAYLDRQVNVYERLFAPVSEVSFATTSDVGFLEDADLVLGVEIDGQAKAYPVRALGYHHLVNDELAGVPLVATY